jgi:AraC family ethanolamine operon transcriptional activator
MDIQEGSFDNFDSFKEAVTDWSLDFTILSKGDFKADFRMFTSETFLLSRETLNAKIEHSGVSPVGFRTFVIPVNYDIEFIWYNKRVSGKEILLFPKNNLIDVVTYNGLDIHLVSIKESVLFEFIEALKYNNCYQLFHGEVKNILLTQEFSQQFFRLANSFLNDTVSSKKLRNQQIRQLIFVLLRYIEYSDYNTCSSSQKTKEIALKKAIEIIHTDYNGSFTIPNLCRRVNVSERTLFDAFKEKYKVAPSEYIKAFRLNEVKKKIYTSRDMSISDIAGEYHFWHLSQFSKDFKKQFGILPSKIRT